MTASNIALLWTIIILLILGVLWFVPIYPKESKSLPLPPQSQSSNPQVGSFRIAPTAGFKIEVQQYREDFYDGHYMYWDGVQGGIFDTEEEAEAFIRETLRRLDDEKRAKEEHERQWEDFKKAHPSREVPPYRYSST